MIIAIIISFVIGLIFPVRWILAIWLEDRLLSHALGISALLSHLAILGYLEYKAPLYGAIYGVSLSIIVSLMPLFGLQSETRKRIRQARADIIHYRAMLTRHPENAGVHSALADAYLEARQFDEALSEYQQAIKLDPVNYRIEEHKIKLALQAKMLFEQKHRKKQ